MPTTPLALSLGECDAGREAVRTEYEGFLDSAGIEADSCVRLSGLLGGSFVREPRDDDLSPGDRSLEDSLEFDVALDPAMARLRSAK